jgi:protein gp37
MYRDKRRYGQDPETVVRSKPPTFNKPLRWEKEQAEMLSATGDIGRSEKHVEDFGPRVPGRPEPGSLVFLASWSDFFIKEADEWRDEAWEIIRRTPHLIYLILTKRHGRIASNLPADWGDGYPNVRLGVSAEDRLWWDRRVDVLREIPSRGGKFVSFEPALGSPKGASLVGIDQVIIGGESAPARTFKLEWAHEAIAIARRDGCMVFMKQYGSLPVDHDLRPIRLKDAHGADPSEWEETLRIQEIP